MTAIVALGSNLGARDSVLRQALSLLRERCGKITAVSSFWDTEALLLPGAAAQPNYLNAVALLKCAILPEELLEHLMAIEAMLGRTRSPIERWVPRTIDLDLIGVDDLVLNLPDLQLPHPEMHKRRFVLGPLCEIWPEWVHPVLQRSANELLATL